ncbi:DUF3352 domain-containing protein [Phormidium sp. CCY1219]|uniref:DUF3352 domain-containing protein n=1 Tax=Phormidium sp. CCY1219 TaxID=2886104 RepID=UPI002D1E9733|nr:DUF3352 domain-containing protein [Phormidium sp. CCY1219]MEB3829601.1 DUF3352 domain-containing protein [Phormidium sp. CCY1219]
MKPRSFFSILAVTVLLVLLLGVGGLYAIITTGPIELLRSPDATRVEAAMFVSKQAPLMASLLVNADKLEDFARTAAPPPKRSRVRAEFNKIKESFLANTDLDYRRDIAPWLGEEITFALSNPDFDRDIANGRQPGYLLAVETKDPQRSRDFLEAWWGSRASSGSQIVVENYKGVKLIYSQPLAGSQSGPVLGGNWASALLGSRFVLFANYPKVLRDAITNVQATELSLKDNPAYQEAIANMPAGGIGLSFVNVEQFAAWISDRPVESASATAESVFGKVSPSLGIALGLNRQGLLAQTVWNSTAPAAIASALPSLTQPVGALQYLPPQTAFALSGANLQRLWSELSESFAEDEAVGAILRQPLAALQSRWGLDLPQDVFDWVEGEYALGLVPQLSDTREGKTTWDWIFVAERKQAATEGIASLDAIANSQGFSVGPLSLGDRQVYAWTKLATTEDNPTANPLTPVRITAQVEGVHATVGNYEILTTSLEAMDEAIDASRQGSILTHEAFQAAIAPLPESNYGYLYLDWSASQGLLTRRVPVLKLITLVGKPFFKRLESISLSGPAPSPTEPPETPSSASRIADLFIRLSS